MFSVCALAASARYVVKQTNKKKKQDWVKTIQFSCWYPNFGLLHVTLLIFLARQIPKGKSEILL